VIHKQLIAVAGGAAGFVAVFLVWRHAPQLFGEVSLPADDTASRLAYAVHWFILPGLTLLAGIVAAGRRGLYADAIDGTRTPANHGLEINLRYNLNTLEQTVLAAIAWAGLALALAHDELILIPAMAVLFAIGRVTFWIGYLLHPLARAFGMVLTALPTIAAFVWLAWHAW
jgi:MAPEG family